MAAGPLNIEAEMHCCANARHQWEQFRALPGLRLLNLSIPPRMPAKYIKEAFGFFAGSCVQMHSGWRPSCPPLEEPGHYPPGSRVVLQFNANSRDEAAALADSLQALREGGAR